MTSATPWLGTKRVAFVPLYRTVAAPPDQIPPNWEQAILARVLFDPRPQAKGADRSLRAWLRAASSGRADIDPVVVPMQTIDRQNVEADDLEGQLGSELHGQGVGAAILVMLGGPGAGTNRGFWSRTVMQESNGVWLMELIHGLTGFKDLYAFQNDTDPPSATIDSFDQMSAFSQTHPTAFTKHELGWLDENSIVRHGEAEAEYQLQDIGFAQPPVAGRVSAVRIGEDVPYVLVESRSMNDQFEAGMPSLPEELHEYGIAGNGVIAYRVQTTDPTVQDRPDGKRPLYLMTPTPMQPGASTILDDGVRLTVTAALPGGAGIRIDDIGTASGLHVLALHDGRLAHTLRPETGSWAGWGDVFSGGGTGELANITHIAAAGTASGLHVLALHDGRLAHTLRPDTGSWAGWGDVFSGGGTGELANITHIAAAGTASGLHVLALHDGRLAHTLRPDTGSWAGWGDVFSGGGTGELANITHIAAAGTASGLHVLALHDGRLAHTLRPDTGSWAGWGDVFSGGGTGELANITHIAAAGTASGLHVLALHDGRLAHTLRPETGSWAGWGDVFSGGGTGELANITHIAAAGTASGLHVLALHDGRLAHTLRPETGSWAGWGDVFSGGGTGELANITHIAAAG